MAQVLIVINDPAKSFLHLQGYLKTELSRVNTIN